MAPPPARLALVTVGMGACTYHEPEPMAKTVPVSVVLVVTTMAAIGWVVRRSIRRMRRMRAAGSPLIRFPRSVVALLWLPVAPPAVVTGILAHESAFGYRHGKYDPLSWDGTAILCALVAAVTLVVALVAGVVGPYLLAPDPAVHRRGVGLLSVVTGLALLLWGVGLVWVPALVVAVIRRPQPAGAAGSGQGSVGAITSNPRPAAAGIWRRSNVR